MSAEPTHLPLTMDLNGLRVYSEAGTIPSLSVDERGVMANGVEVDRALLERGWIVIGADGIVR